jgi:transcriptional regulator GlxA family with amidase domain
VTAWDPRVTHVVQLMERHRSEPLSIPDLARAVNLSPSYLTRLFRFHIGKSPAEYDRDIRLERARELIRTTFLSIKEVMSAVGWRDPSHFSREFKRRYGLGPREMRLQPPVERRTADQHAV